MIDVLVSAYKQEKFLSKCLDSILDQNINCNIILINPKPSEEYLEIVDNYKENIKTFIHEKDEGCADGLNKAIPHLLNNYSIVLNGDDYFLPESLHTFKKYIKFNFDTLIGWCFLRFDNKNKVKIGRPYKFTPKSLIYGFSWIPHPSTIYNNKVFKDGHKFNAKNKFSWDTELLLDLYKDNRKFYYVDEFYSVFRIHEASITYNVTNPTKDSKIKTIQKEMSDYLFFKVKGKKKNLFDNFLINLTNFSFRVFRFISEKFTINSKYIIFKKYKN